MRKKLINIVVLIGILGSVIFLFNFHIPKKVSRTYNGLEYMDNYQRPVSIRLDVTIKKSLISKTKIDGFIMLDGKSTEISNHLVFNTNGYQKVSTSDSRNIVKIIKDELDSNLYCLNRRNVDIIDGTIKGDLVKRVSNILFLKK